MRAAILSGGARPIAVIDIDGVVADVRHRLHHVESRPKNWDAFFAAAPSDPVLADGVARVSALASAHEIVFVTGRPERCRDDTTQWLSDAGLDPSTLIMRRDGDRRPARQTKLNEIRTLAKRAAVAVVVDDDPEVCATLSAAGFAVERADWMLRSPALSEAQETEGRT